MERSRANAASVHEDAPIQADTGDVRGVTARNALDRVTKLDIDGVEVQGPREGFGSLWRKQYWVRMPGVKQTPSGIVRTWRERFGEFWPEGNTFFGPAGTLDPGDIGLLNLEMPGGVQLASGVIVLDATPESFTLITPEGHMFAGVITFSAFRSGGEPVAQIEIVLRASDPIYEAGLRLFGYRQEDEFWQQVLSNLARYLGADGTPEMNARILDRRYQWSQAGNIISNSLIRSGLFRSTAPFTRLARRFRLSSLFGAQEDVQE